MSGRIEEQDFTAQRVDLTVWKRLYRYALRNRGLVAAVLLSLVVVALVDVAYPLLSRYAIDRFVTPRTSAGLGRFALAYAACVLVQGVGTFLFISRSGRMEMEIAYAIRQEAFEKLQTLSFSFYDRTAVGYLMARMISDVGRLSEMVAWSLVDVLYALFYVASSIVTIFSLNWRLALVVVAVIPPLALVSVFLQRRILYYQRRARRQNSRITGAFNEGITGAKTSKTLGIEEQNTASFRALTKEMHDCGIRAARLNAVYIPLVLFCSTAAVAIVLLRGGYMVQEQVLQIATLSAFTTYAVGIFEPIQMTAANIAEFISLQASIERVTGLLDEKPQIADTPEVIARYGDAFHPKRENWEPLRGDIEFRDVTFRYPDGGEDVLSHFSLKIPAGTTVAIVGETGAGKSTLVNLACRFFEPTSGQILIDGRDYRERSQLWLHSNIGYVLQNPHLFSGTIRENIRYGRLDATDAEVEAAARTVSADQVAAKLEKGWDSDVGEGGDRLSTGEKQLISFARAVLADPRIFVLDEATSSIDTQTEQLIQNAIDHLLRDRTSFLIAHRLSTIRKADLILVVRDGRIVEQGRHLELLQKGGYYHDLYTRQFAEESAARILK